jgi:hypothetical protein
MKITSAEFDSLAADLKAALDHFKVSRREQTELLTIVASTKVDIVEPGRRLAFRLEPAFKSCQAPQPRGSQPGGFFDARIHASATGESLRKLRHSGSRGLGSPR